MVPLGSYVYRELSLYLEESLMRFVNYTTETKTNGKDWKVFFLGSEIGMILPYEIYGSIWYRAQIHLDLIHSSSFETLEEAVEWIKEKSQEYRGTGLPQTN